MENGAMENPWEHLTALIEAADAAGTRALIQKLGPFEIARGISRLNTEDQMLLLELLGPSEAAGVLGEVSDDQAADLIEQMPVDQAAAIVDQLRSDDQADVLSKIADEEARAIIEQMSPDEASDALRLMKYPEDTAGGLMITEFVAFRKASTVGEVIADLGRNRKAYADYSVQYLYVVDAKGKLGGVMRLRDLVFSPAEARLEAIMIRSPLSIPADADLNELEQFFERHNLFGVPVVDGKGRLVGVVRRSALEEATGDRATREFLGVSGIVRGEEFRSMPLLVRSGRRLSWLTINIVLNIIAASIIALYTDTLTAVIALAVFLPMISDMSGCSGNQAVAVSMRELALGLVHPREVGRVIFKEISVGAINGLVLGTLLGLVAFAWKGNIYLGLVVAAALTINTVVAVALGGVLPLLFKRLKLDPALVSGPVLTTVTDMCGFFLVLSIATMLLPKLL